MQCIQNKKLKRYWYLVAKLVNCATSIAVLFQQLFLNDRGHRLEKLFLPPATFFAITSPTICAVTITQVWRPSLQCHFVIVLPPMKHLSCIVVQTNLSEFLHFLAKSGWYTQLPMFLSPLGTFPGSVALWGVKLLWSKPISKTFCFSSRSRLFKVKNLIKKHSAAVSSREFGVNVMEYS